MSSNSGQKTIARQRPPRVQIEYDVELYGASKKVELPMVVGVMADLYGQREEPPPKLEDRKFLEIDQDNFDSRMRAMKPRVAASVPNRLTGDGALGIDLTFQSIDDFSPAAIANNVEPLRRLLEARRKLSDLVAFMDGRGDAEALISAALADPARLLALVTGEDTSAGPPGKPSTAPGGTDGDDAAPTTTDGADGTTTPTDEAAGTDGTTTPADGPSSEEH
jgi:type VI secretion system protein ImpB